MFGSFDILVEASLDKNFFLTIGPGFTYFPDQFVYGYWDGRYAPIVGNTIYVTDPVSARNYLLYIKCGAKYRF
jgi:hypothetical protein